MSKFCGNRHPDHQGHCWEPEPDSIVWCFGTPDDGLPTGRYKL